MEHDMKISPSVVRRLRTERGWPQEQLAAASGLSLRTVQRVEADGIASMNTAVSLAATYGVPLMELQGEAIQAADQGPASGPGRLILGIAIITVAAISESGRLPSQPQSDVFAALDILTATVGILLLVPALVRLLKRRQYAGMALAAIGAPLVTLLAGGAIFALVSGRTPSWQLLGMGAAGAALLVMASRELRRGGTAER